MRIHHHSQSVAAKILNADESAQPPVEQVVRIQLALNLKTAMALGVASRPARLGCADEVTE
jgi:hypothetical protein